LHPPTETRQRCGPGSHWDEIPFSGGRERAAWLDLEPGSALEQLAVAAVRYRIALGPIAGCKTLTLHDPGAVSGARESAKPLTTARDGTTHVLFEPLDFIARLAMISLWPS